MSVTSWRIAEILHRQPRVGASGAMIDPGYLGWVYAVDDGNEGRDDPKPLDFATREEAEAALADMLSTAMGRFNAECPTPTVNDMQWHCPGLMVVVPFDASAYGVGFATPLCSSRAGGSAE